MEKKSHQSLRCQSITNLYQILRRKKTISVSSLHLNVLQSLMIVLYPINQILFLILVDHPFNSKTRISLRLYTPLTIIKLMVMMIYICIYIYIYICNSSLVRPLSIIFKNYLQTETFLNNWKQSNVVPILKKVTRNCCKIVAHSRCCQYVVKFLKELSSTIAGIS